MNNNKLQSLLPDMAVFVIVAEEESFSAAGRKLGVAASSVSRSIRRLEAQLQSKLFERTTRQVHLTDIGRDVYSQCKQMMASAQTAVQAAQSHQASPTGLVRVAAPKAFANQVLSPMMMDFLQAYPAINVHLQVADHFIDPIGDDVDLIFRLSEQPIEGLVAKRLGSTRRMVCATPEYLAAHTTIAHPNDLAHHSCISLGEQMGDDRWRFSQNTQTIRVKTDNRLSANHTEIRKAAVLRHLGVSVFPDFTVQALIDSGELVELLTDWHVGGNYQGDILLQFAQTSYMPQHIRLFIDFMQAQFTV